MFVLAPQKERLAAAKQKLAQRDNDYAKVVAAQTGAAKERLDKEIAGLHAKVDPYVLLSGDSSKLVVDIGKIARELGITNISQKGGQNEQSQKTFADVQGSQRRYEIHKFQRELCSACQIDKRS